MTYPLLDPATGDLTWRDREGATLTIGARTESSTVLGESPLSMLLVAGCRLSLTDARVVESALRQLRQALEASERRWCN